MEPSMTCCQVNWATKKSTGESNVTSVAFQPAGWFVLGIRIIPPSPSDQESSKYAFYCELPKRLAADRIFPFQRQQKTVPHIDSKSWITDLVEEVRLWCCWCWWKEEEKKPDGSKEGIYAVPKPCV